MVSEKISLSPVKLVPESLIYEMDEGQPIYYRGYKDVLNKTKTLEQIMGTSILQSLLIELIKDSIKLQLGKDYTVLSSELGIQFSKKSWRNTDIAVFLKKDLIAAKNEDKYAAIPPEIVIEVDTKADLEEMPDPLDYFYTKTDQLLLFGVKQVLWVFTKTEKFMLAVPGKRWETGNWSEEVVLLNGVKLNVKNLLETYYAD